MIKFVAAAIAALGLLGATATAGAQNGPPPPVAVGGQPVTLVASGLGTPTSFAFGDGAVFEGDGGNNQGSGPPNGGVFLLQNGQGTELAGSPQFVAGLAWFRNSLFVSGGSFGPTGPVWTLQRWSGFNGSTFASRSVIYTAPRKFQGFNGIAFGPNGRLYVGVDVGLINNNDHGPATRSPYLYDILSMSASGKRLRVFASGIRQPWQLAFNGSDPDPYVSDLGQDSGVKNPPDFLLHVAPGDNYGFPACNHTSAAKCQGFASPFATFSPHTDIMGVAIIGDTLYMTSFVGTDGQGPGGEVVSMPLSGGALTPVVTGFVAPVVGLGQNDGTLYFGELTGQVFSTTP